MNEKEDVSSLLKNIQKGLKVYTVKEFNDAITSILEGKAGSKARKQTNVVLQCVCDEFEIPLKDLLESSSRGAIQDARKMSVCILHFNMNLTVRYISQRVFGKRWFAFVTTAIKRHKHLNENIKPDKEYKERYSRIEKQIQHKLNK